MASFRELTGSRTLKLVTYIGEFATPGIGIPGEFGNPRFTDAVDAVVATARKHKKSLGRLVGSPEEGADHFRQGFDFICCMGDIWLLQRALNEGFASIRASLEEQT